MIFCVCEDNPRQLTYMTDMLKELTDKGDHEYYQFDTPQKLMMYAQHNHIDVLIIDIDLGKDNGIEWAKKIYAIQWKLPIIFVTAHTHFRTEVYEVEHKYYLEKPIQKEKLIKAIKKAISAAIERKVLLQSRSLLIKNREVQTVVGFHEIIYMESKGRKLNVYCEPYVKGMLKLSDSLQDGADSSEPIVTYASMKVVVEQLDERFNYCHKSFTVNMDYIRILDRPKNIFILKNGVEVPISQSRARDSINHFFSYIEKKGRAMFNTEKTS